VGAAAAPVPLAMTRTPKPRSSLSEMFSTRARGSTRSAAGSRWADVGVGGPAAGGVESAIALLDRRRHLAQDDDGMRIRIRVPGHGAAAAGEQARHRRGPLQKSRVDCS
jgi:hypothetical protein